MRPLLQHASRLFFADAIPIAKSRTINATFSKHAAASKTAPAICWSCQARASSTLLTKSLRLRLRHLPETIGTSRRQLSSSKDNDKNLEPSQAIPMPPPPTGTDAVKQDDRPASSSPEEHLAASSDIQEAVFAMPPPSDPEPTKSPAEPEDQTESTKPKSEEPIAEENIARVAAEDLPSHREGQRWDFSKRMSEFMDEVLPKLAVVTQKVNTYTGTDYTSIAALKQEIKDQEKLVKARRQAIEEAKQALDAAHAQQGASQKEVVALLERKHSWSAADLERYMSLIRSEHLNDQAIREAKDAVLAAENALEEARSRLEKRERAQYHEEQIWSDTIRRNSTWVTFGLMGLNILLLLTNLIIIEPWRRKRMVKEIKAALEEAQRPVTGPTPTPTAVAAAAPVSAVIPNATTIPATAAIEAEIDQVVEPIGPLLDETPGETASQEASATHEAVAPTVEAVDSLHEDTLPSNATVPASESSATGTPDPIAELAATDIQAELDHDRTRLEKITAKLEELVSDEQISVRKKDLTAAVCASAAAGWVCAIVAFWIVNRA